MKLIAVLVAIGVTSNFARSAEKIYTGSTPAAQVVRTFLGIGFKDSIDFIRWRLTINDVTYTLECRYGIGKPNTNGFMKGGESVSLKGSLSREKNKYSLRNSGKVLSLAELNPDLLYILDSHGRLLVGTSGWSFVLNSLSPIHSNQLNLTPSKITWSDSAGFQGRTPCGVPGIDVDKCYKLKWYIMMYGNGAANRPARYKILGTAWRQEGGSFGSWRIVEAPNNRIIYQLLDEKGNPFIRLLKLDDNTLLFVDADGKLLVGNEDFSYVLNRCW